MLTKSVTDCQCGLLVWSNGIELTRVYNVRVLVTDLKIVSIKPEVIFLYDSTDY